ncbi:MULTISPECIES: response regulator [Alteromonas]|nr:MULTISPECIES: response regulator [Alteromonas]MAF71923.1 hypothetical protein [Alteromonas sp.]MBU35265.1 hypothetical protein [Alteromonas sp.]QPL48700.1 response regulator [Alteromonas sp. B31-7]|tara:strand:+ start:89 stop:1723 length:1635 start_codon:yes stop_codon:yes gene_type:complete
MKPNIAKRARVLVAEDQALAKSHMKYALDELGFEHVDYVVKPTQALNALSQQHYDAVICAYDLREDHGGYCLFETLKAQHLVPLTTGFIFTSADTSPEAVHAIVELQPDEFLAKPFSVNQLEKRLSKVIARKMVLNPIYQYMDEGNLEGALMAVEAFILEPKYAEYFPLALKVKGDLLLLSKRYDEAKSFFQGIINVQEFAWAKYGLCKSLVNLKEFEDAERAILSLALNLESNLASYDLLAELKIREEAFDDALECINIAREVSPRNVKRHQTAMELSRITHDYQEQFDSARKIVRYAKQSIHECAEHYLTAARAGVDFAMTSSPSEVSHIVQQTNDYLRELKTAYPKEDVAQQVHVINARICYLQNDSEKAKTMMESLDYRHWEDKPTEALIDSAKAFHEVGLQGNALKILEVLEQKLSDSDSDSDEPNLVSFYIKQEKREKASIPLSPKSLNNAAVLHYQQGDLAKSFNTFLQAYQVMPKNPAIALNLLQAITMRAKQGQPRINKVVSLVKRCRTTIESSELTEEQTQRYNNMKTVLNQVA